MSTSTTTIFSDNFSLSAGTVLIKKSNSTVCVLFRGSEEREEYLLPKGRKQIDISLEETAVVETLKETGYHCSLLPLTMPTRATPQVQIGHTPDRAEWEGGCREPLAVTESNTEDDVTSRRWVYWYAAEVDESREQDLTTNISCEKFNAQFFPFDEAVDILTMKHEADVLRRTAELYRKTY